MIAGPKGRLSFIVGRRPYLANSRAEGSGQTPVPFLNRRRRRRLSRELWLRHCANDSRPEGPAVIIVGRLYPCVYAGYIGERIKAITVLTGG